MWYYISGGERSGKTNYAMQIANELSARPVYLATGRIQDGGFKSRVEKHIATRPENWETICCEKFLSRSISAKKVVVIDCVTMWLANFFFDMKKSPEKTIIALKKEIEKLSKLDNDLIFVSNEIGMGIHPCEKMNRDFIEVQGLANQYISGLSDKAFLMISGLPLVLKK